MNKHRIRSADNTLWIELTKDSWIPVENSRDEIDHNSIHEFISDNFIKCLITSDSLNCGRRIFCLRKNLSGISAVKFISDI